MNKEALNMAVKSFNGYSKCSICGRFMRRLGLISRIRLELECGIKRTHICIKEEIIYETCEYLHH